MITSKSGQSAITSLFLASVCLLAGMQMVIAQDNVHEKLQPLAAFVGKTWVGEFENAGEKAVDVSKWEWALQGQAIRITHSLNDGEYGGETFMVWDSVKESIVYFYFTTGGFYTTGSVEILDGKFISYEEVTGNTDGITAVRSTSTIQEDGSLLGESEYLKNDEWVPGHTAVYREDPTAVVKL